MFREIRTSEKFYKEEKEEKGYLKIKPEKTMSMKEMEEFWLQEMAKAASEFKTEP